MGRMSRQQQRRKAERERHKKLREELYREVFEFFDENPDLGERPLLKQTFNYAHLSHLRGRVEWQPSTNETLDDIINRLLTQKRPKPHESSVLSQFLRQLVRVARRGDDVDLMGKLEELCTHIDTVLRLPVPREPTKGPRRTAPRPRANGAVPSTPQSTEATRLSWGVVGVSVGGGMLLVLILISQRWEQQGQRVPFWIIGLSLACVGIVLAGSLVVWRQRTTLGQGRIPPPEPQPVDPAPGERSGRRRIPKKPYAAMDQDSLPAPPVPIEGGTPDKRALTPPLPSGLPVHSAVRIRHGTRQRRHGRRMVATEKLLVIPRLSGDSLPSSLMTHDEAEEVIPSLINETINNISESPRPPFQEHSAPPLSSLPRESEPEDIELSVDDQAQAPRLASGKGVESTPPSSQPELIEGQTPGDEAIPPDTSQETGEAISQLILPAILGEKAAPDEVRPNEQADDGIAQGDIDQVKRATEDAPPQAKLLLRRKPLITRTQQHIQRLLQEYFPAPAHQILFRQLLRDVLPRNELPEPLTSEERPLYRNGTWVVFVVVNQDAELEFGVDVMHDPTHPHYQLKQQIFTKGAIPLLVIETRLDPLRPSYREQLEQQLGQLGRNPSPSATEDEHGDVRDAQ